MTKRTPKPIRQTSTMSASKYAEVSEKLMEGSNCIVTKRGKPMLKLCPTITQVRRNRVRIVQEWLPSKAGWDETLYRRIQ